MQTSISSPREAARSLYRLFFRASTFRVPSLDSNLEKESQIHPKSRKDQKVPISKVICDELTSTYTYVIATLHRCTHCEWTMNYAIVITYVLILVNLLSVCPEFTNGSDRLPQYQNDNSRKNDTNQFEDFDKLKAKLAEIFAKKTRAEWTEIFGKNTKY